MRRGTFTFALLIGLTAWIPITTATSFDCGAVSLPAEKLICSEADLSALDDRLARAYSVAIRDSINAPQVRAQQRAWLIQRNKCTSVICIGDAFRRRLGELGVMTAAVPSAAAPGRERIGIGSHVGESAYVVGKSGIGTDHATIEVLMDWPREVQACSDEYLTYTPGEKNEDGYNNCIQSSKGNFNGPYRMTAQANCQTGEMLGFAGKKTPPRFYVGQVKTVIAPNEQNDGKGLDYNTHFFDYEGFRVGDYTFTGAETDGKIFRRLCPVSFTGPPKINPPQLHLSIDCNGQLTTAEQMATESGMPHILNMHIIDAWNVKSEGDTWYAASCSANIMLNNGAQFRMIYETVPSHGKYFLSTHILQ